jgi:predicted nucleic acid-binding protein
VIRTYIDSGVLIAASHGTGDVGRRALAAIADDHREYVSSDYVRIEVIPQALYHKRAAEVRFYEAFFEGVSVYVSFNAMHWTRAYEEACECGLAPIDALHVATAVLAQCEECVTTERSTSRLHRARNIRIVSIA